MKTVRYTPKLLLSLLILSLYAQESSDSSDDEGAAASTSAQAAARYRCSIAGCYRSFDNKSLLTMHERTHTGERPCVCDYQNCGMKFKLQHQLKEHIRTHTGERPYHCDICKKCFSQSSTLTKHKRTHARRDTELAQNVSADTLDTSSYETPESALPKIPIPDIYLNLQDEGAAASTSAQAARRHRCPVEGCGKSYDYKGEFTRHERTHTGIKPFRCLHPGCGESFTEKGLLNTHRRASGHRDTELAQNVSHDISATSSYGTSECALPEIPIPDIYLNLQDEGAAASTSAQAARRHRCPAEGCDKSFTTSDYLKNHIRTHTGERPYYCTESGCGMSFTLSSHLTQHIRTHTGEEPYVCPHQSCGIRFKHSSNLTRHKCTCVHRNRELAQNVSPDISATSSYETPESALPEIPIPDIYLNLEDEDEKEEPSPKRQRLEKDNV